MDQVDVTLRKASISNEKRTYRIIVRTCVLSALLLAKLRPWMLEILVSRIITSSSGASFEDVKRTRNDVIALSRICAGEGCLERSLATVFMCFITRRGVPSWHLGARTEPFRAHAWVEVSGVPVGEEIDPNMTRLIVISPPVVRSGKNGTTGNRHSGRQVVNT